MWEHRPQRPALKSEDTAKEIWTDFARKLEAETGVDYQGLMLIVRYVFPETDVRNFTELTDLKAREVKKAARTYRNRLAELPYMIRAARDATADLGCGQVIHMPSHTYPLPESKGPGDLDEGVRAGDDHGPTDE